MKRAARRALEHYVAAGRPLSPLTRWVERPLRWYYHRSPLLKHDLSGSLRARALVQLHRALVGEHPADYPVYGERLRFRSTGNTMAIHGYYVGEIEYHLAAFLIRQLRSGFVMLDVGAHHGIHTAVVAYELEQRGLDGHVHSFEPDPGNVALLEHNVRANRLDDRVTIHPVAVGDAERIEDLLLCEADNSSHTFAANQAHALADARATLLHVRSIRLDDLALERVDLVKIDVQGAEPRVLAGAERLIERWRPTLVVEAVPGWPSTAETAALLRRHGYRIHGLRGDGTLCAPNSREAFVSWDWVGTPA